MNESDMNNSLNAFNSSLAGLSNSIGAANLDKQNKEFAREEAEKQRSWNEEMWNKGNAWNLEMWEMTNEYNSPASQVARLREAGLNPLFYGLDGSSASQQQAAQPLGYERADYKSTINPTAEGLNMYNQMRALSKDIELKNAQIDKTKADTQGVELDSEWKDKTMDARVESEKLQNSLTKEKIGEVQSVIKKNEQEVKESIARTDNEIEKKGLIIAEKVLATNQANEIIALLPYKQNLMQAQTEAQKAAAAASYWNAMYNKKLIDSGYIDKQIEEIEARIRRDTTAAEANEAVKMLNEWKLSVKNGTVFELADWETKWYGALYSPKRILNEIFQITSTASEAIGSGLSGIFH